MPLEIEVKVKVDDLEVVRRRLREIGASPAGKVLERNVFFDTNDQALYRAGRGLRLRTNTNHQTGAKSHFITCKGPREAGPLKRREEIEVGVNEGDAAEALFRALGYEVVLSFEKRRETWKLGQCKVELDELPQLGTFVEVEGPDDAAVIEARRQLGLADHPSITEAYVGLLMDYLKRSGRKEREVRF